MLRHLRNVSVGAAVTGVLACQFLHLCGQNSETATISRELAEGNWLAWLFMVAFASLVFVSFVTQVMSRHYVHSSILAAALAGIIVIVCTDRLSQVHIRALIVTGSCLLASTAIYARKFGSVTFAIVLWVLSSIVAAVLLLVATGGLFTNPGFAEKILFVVYAVATVYFFDVATAGQQYAVPERE